MLGRTWTARQVGRALCDQSMLKTPLLLCLDIQRGFLEPGMLHAPNAPRALVHGRRMLAHARERRWQVAHCLLRARTGPAPMSAHGARPIDGFEPRVREMVFERDSLSAYGNQDFLGLMNGAPGGALVTGLSASLTVLATSIDAFERGHRLIFAHHALAGASGVDADAGAHEAVARDVARFLGFFVSGADGLSPLATNMIDGQPTGTYK
jgi:nicotinamidase-related amidase